MNVKVIAVHRPDLPGVWTPGRLWSSLAPTEIEVLDQEDDPVAPEGLQAHPTVLGRKSFARIQADPLLSVHTLNADEDLHLPEIEALKAEVADLKAQLEAATAPPPQAKKSK